jgi:hypothetical protein
MTLHGTEGFRNSPTTVSRSVLAGASESSHRDSELDPSSKRSVPYSHACTDSVRTGLSELIRRGLHD